jgi:tricorn protease interacting factor F2/3
MEGAIRIRIRYEGQINDKMAGFYRSQYTHSDKTRYIAVTQFEESDARRAFPCMDHPAKKATFDVTLDIDRDLTAISNGAIAREVSLDGGKKRVTFERTPKMSTYLVFFGVGEFEFTRDAEDPRVRVATLPGMKPYAMYGLEFGRKALAFSEDYYGLPYPLPKMDLIAIPDFAFGAMENWGAITFRENLLLHYPEITSKSGEERICEVIARNCPSVVRQSGHPRGLEISVAERKFCHLFRQRCCRALLSAVGNLAAVPAGEYRRCHGAGCAPGKFCHRDPGG